MKAASCSPYASLPLRSRLLAAVGYELILAAVLIFIYLIFRPYLYTSGPEGQHVLRAFAALFATVSVLSVPQILFPVLANWRKSILGVSLVIGGAVGSFAGIALAGEPLPLLGLSLFTAEVDDISSLFSLGLLTLSAGAVFMKMCLSRTNSERVRMETELKLAQGIQEDLLPVVNAQAGMFAAYGVARLASEVGGDFFDVIAPDAPGAPLLVTVGDVAGHNVAAGLMMATAKGAFRGALGSSCPTAATVAAEPAAGNGAAGVPASGDGDAERVRSVLETMNRTVYAHAGRRHFVSCQVGRFDFSARRLVLGNAGHMPVLHWRAETETVEAIAPGGAALGLLPTGSFGVEAVPFSPGDTFLFYTDGLLEAHSGADGAEFGLERAQASLADEAPGATPEALCKRFFEALDAHTGGAAPGDDVTLLAVRIG